MNIGIVMKKIGEMLMSKDKTELRIYEEYGHIVIEENDTSFDSKYYIDPKHLTHIEISESPYEDVDFHMIIHVRGESIFFFLQHKQYEATLKDLEIILKLKNSLLNGDK